MGVKVITDFPSDDELGLESMKAGERVVGTLTEEEFALYCEMVQTSKRLQAIGKAVAARKMREMADRMETNGDLLAVAADVVSNVSKDMFPQEEEEIEFFRLQGYMNVMTATFYWTLNEKYGVHHFKSGVRTNRRFVVKERRSTNG